MKTDGTAIKEVRVTKPPVVALIVEEQADGKDATATQTVERVIREYRTMKRFIKPRRQGARAR